MTEKEWNFITKNNRWTFRGSSQKQALKDCVAFFEHLVKDAKEKNFSRDSEFYDNFIKIVKVRKYGM